MRMLVVHPGSSISTSDVHDGLVPALKRQGADIWRYNLDARIAVEGEYMHWLYRREQRRARREERAPRLDRPGAGPILARAGQDILARALWNDIDWVFIVSGMYLHPDILILLRKAGLRVAVLLTESPYDDDQQGPFIGLADVAWTNERTSVNYLRQWNPNVFHLPHAFDPSKHHVNLPDDDVPQHDVLFIGTGFQERIEMLEGVNWEGINLALYGTWDLLGSRHRLRKHIAGGYVDNRIAAMMYRNAAINLNIYRTSMGFGRHASRVEGAESLNPRALELAACGAFTVSDARAEVEETFGGLVPVCRDAQELEEAIRFYLAHPQERARMADALPQAVEGMTFDARAAQILSDLHTRAIVDRSPVALDSA